MTGNSGTDDGRGPNRLHPDDLIDDHELVDVDGDRLSHEGIADQLAEVVRTVQVPANIALYGPWGSGKSGIANLLKNQVDNRDGVRFARFDAFKYAALPLRRNFVSVVATELGIGGDAYHDDLYNGRTKTELTMPAAKVAKVVWIFTLLVFVLTAVLLLGVTIVAGLTYWADGHFRDTFKSFAKIALVAGLVPAALLSGLIALATKTFQVDRSTSKPESEEQFEQLFRDLVMKSKAKRLVVFVDELDRCSASEVVETLDTVRTFLGVQNCVFIIAADQRVLEDALTRAAKQETPADDDNPYYSTGSAYLDKVFQYQVSLPPLLTQSVTTFAARLVEGRKGLWADINTPYVLSVLIPTHVTSPRRVKHLLNAFALTYRLAGQRHAAQLLAEDPRDVSAAIAKLACLRVEFPLFARHLEVDADLPDLVLQLLDDPDVEFAGSVSDRAQELARSYALEFAAPAQLLGREDDTESATVTDDDDEEPAAAPDKHNPTAKAHSKQLHNYLRRTRRVRGLSRDLIYQQSTGTVFGLDGEVARAIETSAEDGDVASLRRHVEGLPPAERGAAFDLLAQHIRTGSGVAGPNTARSFLLLIQAMPDLLASRAVDPVCEAICGIYDLDTAFLDHETIESAWKLAKAGTDSGSAALRTVVMSDLANLEGWDNDPPDFMLADSAAALAAAPESATAYITSQILRPDGAANVARLFELNDADLLVTLGAIADGLAARMKVLSDAHATWKRKQDAPAATPAPVAGVATVAPAVAEPEPEPLDPKSLLDAFASQAASRETAVQHGVIRLLLSADSADSRTAAYTLFTRTEPLTEANLVKAVLAATAWRHLTEWPEWLAGVAPSSVGPQYADQVKRLCLTVWQRFTKEDVGERTDIAQVDAALASLAPVRQALPQAARPDLTSSVVENVDFWPRTSEQATVLLDLISRIRVFERAGLVDGDQISAAVVGSLVDTFGNQVAPIPEDDPLRRYVTEVGVPALGSVAGAEEEGFKSIVSEAAESPWLDEVSRVDIALRCVEAVHADPASISVLPDAAAIADLIRDYGPPASAAAAMWVTLFGPAPGDLATIFEALRDSGELTSAFASSASQAQSGWDDDDREAFVRRYLASSEDPVPGVVELDVIGIARLADARAATLLKTRFEHATNNAQRQNVVTLWKHANVRVEKVRRDLVESVIYGLLDLNSHGNANVSAVEMALSALDQLGSPLPHGVKRALGGRVRESVGNNGGLKDRALRVMPRLGYSTQSSWFGLTKNVNYEE